MVATLHTDTDIVVVWLVVPLREKSVKVGLDCPSSWVWATQMSARMEPPVEGGAVGGMAEAHEVQGRVMLLWLYVEHWQGESVAVWLMWWVLETRLLSAGAGTALLF